MYSDSPDESFQEAIERRRRRSERLRRLAEAEGEAPEGVGGAEEPDAAVSGDWVIPADGGLDALPVEAASDEAVPGEGTPSDAGAVEKATAAGREGDAEEVEEPVGEEPLAVECDLNGAGEADDCSKASNQEAKDEEVEAAQAEGPGEDEAGLKAEVEMKVSENAEAGDGEAERDPLAEASRVVEEALRDVASEEWMAQSRQIESTEDEIEEGVEKLGEVIDLKSMPKTQPKRVLSRAGSKDKNSQGSGGQPSSSRGKSGKRSAGKAKGKKRRVSLLDSYFKGL